MFNISWSPKKWNVQGMLRITLPTFQHVLTPVCSLYTNCKKSMYSTLQNDSLAVYPLQSLVSIWQKMSNNFTRANYVTANYVTSHWKSHWKIRFENKEKYFTWWTYGSVGIEIGMFHSFLKTQVLLPNSIWIGLL